MVCIRHSMCFGMHSVPEIVSTGMHVALNGSFRLCQNSKYFGKACCECVSVIDMLSSGCGVLL